MITQFVTFELPLPAELSELQAAIATALQTFGEPLRWAITEVNADPQTQQKTVRIEAIVTTDECHPERTVS